MPPGSVQQAGGWEESGGRPVTRDTGARARPLPASVLPCSEGLGEMFRGRGLALSLGSPRASSPGSQDPRPWLSAYPHRPVHPSKVSEAEKSQLVNETHWQYYGTAGSEGNLTMTWNASALPTRSVGIELWGYEETGEASGRLGRRRNSAGCLWLRSSGPAEMGEIPGRDCGRGERRKEGDWQEAGVRAGSSTGRWWTPGT